MTGALIILAATLATGLLLYLTRGKETSTPPGDTGTASAGKEEPEATCCGRHAVCGKNGAPTQSLYWDDDELDRFAGRDPGSYTQTEVEEFGAVLYTLPVGEALAWGQALNSRGIELPVALRDEWMLLCQDSGGR